MNSHNNKALKVVVLLFLANGESRIHSGLFYTKEHPLS